MGAVAAFKAAGAEIVPVKVDSEGACVEDENLRGAKLVYLTPAHQYPLGITMCLKRRFDVLQWARQTGTMIFEDDYDSEYRYCGRPIPALQSLDCTGQVVFAGSFSKVMFPAMRLGVLVVPTDLIDRLAAIKSVTSQHSALLGQMALCEFIEEGHFGRHIRRMREVYSGRLDVLLDEASKKLAGALELRSIEAGLQTTGWLSDGVNENDAVRAAHEHGVEVVPLGQYTRGKVKRHGLQLGFAAIRDREIRSGVENLAKALERCKPRARGISA
jgi:GntR family transcriptional regulator/MocR family aminotransferase